MFDEALSRTRIADHLSSLTSQIPDAVSRIATWMTNALSCMPDGLLVTNSCGDVLFMNPRAEEITGWRVEEALQRCSSEVFPLFAKTGTRVDSPLREAFVEEQVFRSTECLLAGARGDKMPIEYAAAPIHSEEGEVVGALVVFREQEVAVTSI
jgi:PAS domain S-box-containing protein